MAVCLRGRRGDRTCRAGRGSLEADGSARFLVPTRKAILGPSHEKSHDQPRFVRVLAVRSVCVVVDDVRSRSITGKTAFVSAQRSYSLPFRRLGFAHDRAEGVAQHQHGQTFGLSGLVGVE